MEAELKMTGWIFAGVLAAQSAMVFADTTQRSEAAQALRIAADRIEADYIDAAKAPMIAARLRARADALKTSPVSDEALSDEVTTLLRTLSRDQHFGFRHSAKAMPADIFSEKSATETEAAASRTARINNFGVLKVERLPGNIGLIDLDAFTAPERMRKPLAAAMELLRHCDAMIVDLRYNGGGHARGASLAASYFLPEAPSRLLVRFETRKAAEILEIRTEGVLEAPRFLGKPIYILTGPDTFSAAEMFASVLQHAGRAQIIGVQTRGGTNPSLRVRLTPHFGMMLPTTRGVSPAGQGRDGVGITPNLASSMRDALTVARQAALAQLLREKPDDVMADRWKELLAEMPPGATNPTESKSGN